MARDKNAYEILSIPRDAAHSQVRTEFRAHLRRYRPDTSAELLLKDETARDLIDAYLLLTEGDRTEYDQALRAAERNQVILIPNAVDRVEGVEKLLLLADLAFIRRQYAEAATFANQAREAAQRDARPYVMLGDIAREQKKYDTAMTMYNFAVQFEPDNQRYWQLLNETTELKSGKREDVEETAVTTVYQQPIHLSVILFGILAVVALSAVLIHQRPGQPVFFGIPSMMLILGSGMGVFVGFLCAASGLWPDFNDEMIYSYVFGARERGGDVFAAPIGVVLLLPALLSPWIAMGVYVIVGLLDEHFSPALIMVLSISMLASILNAMMFPDILWPCLILSGTFVFIGTSIGWIFGSYV